MSKNKKPFPSNPKVVTRTYRGPDRRGLYAENSSSGDVEFDDKGNPIWKVKTIRLRRKDDETAKLYAALDSPSLAIEDDETESKPEGYDPYFRNK